MPLFNGLNLFGPCAKCFVDERPRRLRRLRYPGVDGFRVDDLGSDGAEIRVEGRLIGYDQFELGAYESALEQIRIAGIPYQFVDSHGVTHWPVLLVNWRHASQLYVDGATATAVRDYEWSFERML